MIRGGGTLLLDSRPLCVRRQLGGRESLEPFVRNRSSAFGREPVGPGSQPLLGALDCGELLAKNLFETFVELVLVEVGRQVRQVVLVCRLAVVLRPEPAERMLDPLAFGR